jgi:PleD family two-component response regulator
MLARDPTQRPAMPLTVLNALTPFAFAGTRSDKPALPIRDRSSEARVPRVLIADDEELVRRFVRAVIETMGCWCVEAADGITAIDLARQERCDLILLDLRMPRADGYEFAAGCASILLGSI